MSSSISSSYRCSRPGLQPLTICFRNSGTKVVWQRVAHPALLAKIWFYKNFDQKLVRETPN
jgi:hypothetical protein